MLSLFDLAVSGSSDQHYIPGRRNSQGGKAGAVLCVVSCVRRSTNTDAKRQTARKGLPVFWSECL